MDIVKRSILLSRQESQLMVIDFQEKLLPAMRDPGNVIRNAGILMKAAHLLDIPVIVTEQYPKGLGPSISLVRLLGSNAQILPKLTFSAFRDPAIEQAARQTNRPQIVVCGLEAHVCVLQTALDFHKDGFSVFIAADATQSRSDVNRSLALERLANAGVHIVTTEMIVFEWLERAGTSLFKDIAALIR